MNAKGRKALLWISGGLTAAICLVMNFLLIPAIEKSTGGIRCFDMNFGYDFNTAQLFLSRLSEESRKVYLHIQLPLDFVYPAVYCLFFCLALTALLKKKSAWPALPALLAVSDYVENVCTIIMLRGSTLSAGLARFASIVTMVKTVLMYGVFVLLAVLLVRYFIQRRKGA